jgi:hypothetical protein
MDGEACDAEMQETLNLGMTCMSNNGINQLTVVAVFNKYNIFVVFAAMVDLIFFWGSWVKLPYSMLHI